MTKLTFEKATKTKAKLRMAFTGPAKSGKTYTALVLATALANGGRIGLVDTERGSSRKYADIFDFDIIELEEFHPNTYIAAIEVFETAGHAVIILDSLSHEWEGKRGVLELHDDATKTSRSDNSWAAWRRITPLHQGLMDKILRANAHIIATMRSKMAYIQTKDDKGKTEIKKVGLAPVQRQGMEYEFDILAEMRHDHRCVIGDTRCPAVDGASQLKPDGAWFQPIIDWLSDGSEEPARAKNIEPARELTQEEKDAEIRALNAWTQFFYIRWKKLYPADKNGEIAHREFACKSMKELYSPTNGSTIDRYQPILDLLEWAHDKGLKDDQLKDSLGIGLWHEYTLSVEDGMRRASAWMNAQAAEQAEPSAASPEAEKPTDEEIEKAPELLF